MSRKRSISRLLDDEDDSNQPSTSSGKRRTDRIIAEEIINRPTIQDKRNTVIIINEEFTV